MTQDLHALLEAALVPAPAVQEPPPELGTCPSSPAYGLRDAAQPLPAAAQLDPALADGASPWLDAYIAFSRRWSPRAYDGFHEATGLWVLSTAAAGRAMLHFGGQRYTSLYILLCARTSLYTKSTTAEIGLQTLKAAGLDWLLTSDSMTPQKFIHDLAAFVPENYGQLTDAQRERVHARLALAGQRGWFYEEFGQQLAAMMRPNGIMADFRGILRRLDDHREGYAYGTISRGDEQVERPYLALLANLTPAELKPFARAGGALWQDGFYARFAFVTPPEDEPRRKGQFPAGERVIPVHLVEPLAAWHSRLGMPGVEVVTSADGQRRARRGEHTPAVCTLGPGVTEAYYRYYDGLLDLVEKSPSPDLDGNYARSAEKALRVAMLLASLEGAGDVALRHWARGQQVAERWRSDLHALVAALAEGDMTRSEQQEERVVQVLQRLSSQGAAPTAREIGQRIRGMTTQDVERVLGPLVRSGEVLVDHASRTTRYRPA